MFNAEKLLGGMLKQGIGMKGIGIGSKTKIGMGLIGVAFAAVEHFMNNAQGQTSSGGNMPTNSNTGGSFAPPPPPGKMVPPPPPPASQIQTLKKEQDAVLLIRAMIASAAADGYIDEKERQNIISRLESVNLNDEELEFIKKELASPCSIDEIAAQVNSPELAKEVYTVSLIAIEMDTEEEMSYMDTLAARLGIDQTARDQIHNKLGLAI
ncbi:MAG: tellurite resistance TerB family protein [Deltaproteobacteria bacterium]|nr:tellurite resistance TerB family protein [Deltaproteobacteria bacterium]